MSHAFDSTAMANFALQLITDGPTVQSHIDGTAAALAGGCRWIQLRMKDAQAADFLAAGKVIAGLCRQCGATFIVDDHVELVHKLRAGGVHLGKNDMPVDEARKILGPGKIIGATANTADDIRRAAAHGADYIGFGPFRFTATKKNLAPTLGAEGYRAILTLCRREGFTLPVVAIGGITAADVPAILSAGANGVAVAGAILKAPDMAAATAEIIKQINQHKQ